MEMPKPCEAHQRLAQLAGEWIGEEISYASSPEEGRAVGYSSNRMAIDGLFLVNDYHEERGGQVVFRGHGVYGFDPERQRYTMHWFDSMGMPPKETLGTWEGNTLTFENRSEMGHGRYIYTVDAGSYRFRIETSQDGTTWTPLMEGHFKRRC